MIIYNYNKETKEFLSQLVARGNPLEKGKFLIPSNATKIKPLEPKEGFAICFNEEKKEWEYIEDNRGETIYSTTDKTESTISYLGAIKDGFTFDKPKEFDKWNDTKWETDIPVLRISKTNSINSSCEKAIVSGFPSSALGEEYFYGAKEHDQLNYIGAAATGVKQNIKCSKDKKSWSYISHTATQIKQLLKDGAEVKATYLEKYEILKAQVNAASTAEELEQINW